MSESAPVTEGVQTDDIDITSLATWGIVCVVLTVVLMFGLYGLYNSYVAGERQKKSYNAEENYLGKYKEATDEKDTQIATLNSPVRYLDSEGKKLAVPISRAKELTLDEFASER